MNKMMFCLKIGIFQFKNLNLPVIQQISLQFIYFITISTCGEFQICERQNIVKDTQSIDMFHYLKKTNKREQGVCSCWR